VLEKNERRDDPPRTAVLVRRRIVDLDNVSRRGCSFKTLERLDVGDVGLLSVNVAGQMHTQLYRVARSATVPGDDRLYEAGVEFLPMPASTRSIHDLAAQLDDSQSY
jgi:hypothetical protein